MAGSKQRVESGGGRSLQALQGAGLRFESVNPGMIQPEQFYLRW